MSIQPLAGFVMVPGWLLSRKVSPAGLAVYVHLASHGTWNPGTARYDECRPALATMAEKTGLSENSVRKGLRELLKLGGLEPGDKRYDARGGQLPMAYRVIFGNLVPPGSTTTDTPPVQPDTPPGVPPDAPNQEPSTKNPSPTARGSRCPEDFMPSDKTKQWCVDNLPPRLMVNAGNELIKFRNYWTAKTGRGATKLDWEKTFINWMLRAAEGYGTARPVSGGAKPFVQQADEYKTRRAEADRLHTEVGQRLLDEGVPAMEAARHADEAKRAYLTRESVETNAVGGYIEGVILDETRPKEVTGS